MTTANEEIGYTNYAAETNNNTTNEGTTKKWRYYVVTQHPQETETGVVIWNTSTEGFTQKKEMTDYLGTIDGTETTAVALFKGHELKIKTKTQYTVEGP